jgi:hypothetical protein
MGFHCDLVWLKYEMKTISQFKTQSFKIGLINGRALIQNRFSVSMKQQTSLLIRKHSMKVLCFQEKQKGLID